MSRYLIGPTRSERALLWQPLRQAGQALTIGPPGSDVEVRSGETWEQIAARFPAAWQPDVLVLDLDETVVPPALWEAPCPVVALTAHWRRQWHACRRLLPHCELVLTDAAGVEVLRRQGVTHARAVHLVALDPPPSEGDLPEGERDIDLLVVADLHLQREQPTWLGRLATLAERWRVRVVAADPGSAHRALLQRTRVVMAQPRWSTSDQFLGEVLASGCLLFRDRHDHLPGVEESTFPNAVPECVWFDDGDLEAVLERHLGDESGRRQIVEAGRQWLSESSPAMVLQQWTDLIEQELPALRER
jgi:hypothetical protein